MKKVLFASTALIATAGIASADVAISGYAEMGVVGGSGFTGTNVSNNVTQFLQDIDVRFTLSGETDGGLTFGAGVDLDEVASNVGSDDAGATVFISGDFGTLTMGDTDGGFDAGMQEVNIGSGGSIADNETSHAGYSGNNGLDGAYDGQVLSYQYAVSGFTITGSVEMDDDGVNAARTVLGTSVVAQVAGTEGDAIYGIGAAYSGSFGGGSYTIGAGYQTVADLDTVTAGSQGVDVVGISATVALDSGLSAGINYSMITNDQANSDGVHTAIGVSYTFDAVTLHANYGRFDWEAGAFAQDATGFGLAARYDLGGGLTAHLGYNSSDYGNVNAVLPANVTADTSSFSLGLAMSF